MAVPSRDDFLSIVRAERARGGTATLAIPLIERLLDDQLTPVTAYRRLVAPDERTAPSFLLESVEGGERQGRYSMLGAQPRRQMIARGHVVEWVGEAGSKRQEPDPLRALRAMTAGIRLLTPAPPLDRLPFYGGLAGYAAYDAVRYAECERLSFDLAPADDRGLPDLDFGFYDSVVVFDHAEKIVNVLQLALVEPAASPEGAYDHAAALLAARVAQVEGPARPLRSGRVAMAAGAGVPHSNLTREQHAAIVARALDYIRGGDIFQVVLGQRFERKSKADPFDVYRVLRSVNPSPYMVYMQGRGCILVASSPEILCRVRREEETRIRRDGETEAKDGGGAGLQTGQVMTTLPSRQGRGGTGLQTSQVSSALQSRQGRGGTGLQTGQVSKALQSRQGFVLTTRPLAGTRRRGRTPDEDAALERELLADAKERAEHIMLVDLGRNDAGIVSQPGTIDLPRVMEVERYSHVMHISSTVTGRLRPGLDCWDALRATLPVGTISGAPKIRAMQIIDELEPLRRGPYGGGMGYVGLDGQMDIALALRTIVVPTSGPHGPTPSGEWTYHLQASGGIVADSQAPAEYQETVNKAAAMARAIELAESAFDAP